MDAQKRVGPLAEVVLLLLALFGILAAPIAVITGKVEIFLTFYPLSFPAIYYKLRGRL